jgi:putative hydrolase of the HAD superfamily
MSQHLQLIGFDADDTLWFNEFVYAEAKRRFVEHLGRRLPPEQAERVLNETELANVERYGYGIKSFALSMVEAALTLRRQSLQAADIEAVLAITRQMLDTKVPPMDHSAEVVARLAGQYRLLLITKGDTWEQSRKLGEAEIMRHFAGMEIVADKTPEVYQSLLERYDVTPASFLMVGNSLRSDILPVAAIGGWAVYIPAEVSWEHEYVAGLQSLPPGCWQIKTLDQLPGLIGRIEGSTA